MKKRKQQRSKNHSETFADGMRKNWELTSPEKGFLKDRAEHQSQYQYLDEWHGRRSLTVQAEADCDTYCQQHPYERNDDHVGPARRDPT
jgi:hypothetical protein